MKERPSRTEIQWLLKDKYGGKKTPEFFEDLKRLETGEPVDYIIGWVPFLGVKVDLSQRPLIPRIETEEWAEKAIEDMQRRIRYIRSARHSPQPPLSPRRPRHPSGDRAVGAPRVCSEWHCLAPSKLHVLDMFAGAGNIGLAVLKHVPSAHVDFAEKSRSCLKGIAKSCRNNGFNPKRYRIIESDVFSAVRGRYDYILGNPPYVAEEDEHLVEDSVKEWEPRMAVFGGEKGDRFIRRYLLGAPRCLKRGGKVYMEFDSFQKKNVEKILQQAGYSSFACKKDRAGRWRWCVAVK